MCLFLMIQKAYSMIYLLYQCYGENHDGRANMVAWYQTQHGYETEQDAVAHYERATMYGTLQLSIALLVLVLAIVVLSISMRFHPVAAVFMLTAQILDIPFQPHIPDYLLLVLTVNQFGLIFFLPMVVSDNLFQVLGAYLLLYANLCIRLHEHWQMKIQWFTILFVCFMNCFIGLNMVSSILSNCKTIFHERYES